jgi:hypothetical protein
MYNVHECFMTVRLSSGMSAAVERESHFRTMNLYQFGDGFQPSFVCLSDQSIKQEGRGDGQEILECVGLSFAYSYMSPIYYGGCLSTVD